MSTNRSSLKTYLLMILLAAAAVACQDNSEEELPSAQFEVTIENTGGNYPIMKSGTFTTPVGASEPAPIGPGGVYEIEFTAPEGARLSLATMFVQSNDWIYSFGEEGLPLYNSDGSKVTGDVTSQLKLYDVGTEQDQEPGTGSNQAPRQGDTDTGPEDDNMNVRQVDNMDLPSVHEVIRVTLNATGEYGFRVRIENVSTGSTLQTSEGDMPVPLSPGIWLVHGADQNGLLFTEGAPDYGEGLEAIAEDGMPGELAGNLADKTGLTVPFSPGAYAVYSGENPIF
ncbi:MAG: spondin domain-containing protein, partial [Balneolaceae bacterium]|nr:spondin domain-containing protein [Balneolaceae bacterium]